MTTLTAATPQPPMGTTPGPVARPHAAPSAPAHGAGLSGADVIRIIRQRLVMIIILWVIFIGATFLTTWLVIRYWPQYKGMAYIQVESINPPNVMEPLKPQEAKLEEVERLLQTQALLVKSPDVLLKALEDPELRDTVWFREAEEEQAKKGEAPLDLLGDIISSEPVRESNYVGVTVTWKVPSEVPTLVNTIVSKYINLVEQQQKQSIRKMDEQLGEELGRAKSQLDQRNKDIEAFRGQEEVMGTSQRESEEKLLTLTALVTELQVDLLGKQSQYEALSKSTPDEMPITAELQNLLNTDPFIFQLEQRLQTADEELRAGKQRFGDNHKVVKGAQTARDIAADRVQEERARKTLSYQTEQIEQAKRNYLEAQEQLLKIKENLNLARSEQRDKDIKQAQYLRMQEEAVQLRTQYEQLLEQKHILTLTLHREKTVQIEVKSWAIAPKRRASPKWEIWVPAGTILGLAISLGFAMLLELADKSVRTPRDVLRHSIQVLGTIPSTEDDEIEISRVETASLDAPHSIVAESFRNLRANLFFSAPAEQQGSILVTSPSGGNGKTTVATNLAISIALSGRRVLLVDANFRRASLPRIFQGMRDEGLSNILIGQAHLDDVVTPTSVPGLDVLSAGPIPPNPAELLGSSYLRDLIIDARARYDQVIFDGPPVLLVSDAIVLAGAVDGVLLVCQYRLTSRGALQRTHSQLEAMNSRIFGAVLNKVETRAGGYFRKAYREFYEYHEPGEPTGEVPQLKAAAESSQLQAEPATEAEAGETPIGEAALTTPAALEAGTPPAIGESFDTPSEIDSTEPIAPATGSDWGSIDLDREINEISGGKLLGEEDFEFDDGEGDKPGQTNQPH
jgi:succinoglycan biosynthesis transport protein ExoP